MNQQKKVRDSCCADQAGSISRVIPPNPLIFYTHSPLSPFACNLPTLQLYRKLVKPTDPLVAILFPGVEKKDFRQKEKLTSCSYSKNIWKFLSLLKMGWEVSLWRKTSWTCTVFLKTARYSLKGYRCQQTQLKPSNATDTGFPMQGHLLHERQNIKMLYWIRRTPQVPASFWNIPL